MKKLPIVFFVVTLLCVLCVSASSDFIVWDFSDKNTYDSWHPTSTAVTTLTASGTYVTGSEDNMNFSYYPKEEIMLEDYGFFAIAFANVSIEGDESDGNFQFYHWTENVTGNPYLSGTLCEGEGVQYITFDTKNGNNPKASWSGKVTRFRFDPMRIKNAREYLIAYAGLFKDEATFEAYKEAHPVNAQKPYKVSPYVNELKPIIWDFTKQSDLDMWTPHSSASATATTNGMLYSGKTDDLFFYHYPSDPIVLDNYPYVSVGYSGYTQSGGFQLYHWSDKNTGNPYLYHSPMPTLDEGELFFDLLTDAPDESAWTGTLSRFRLDPCRSQNGQRSGYIKYLALFPDMMSYNNFKGNNAQQHILNTAIGNTAFGTGGKGCVVDYDDSSAIITTEDKAVSFTAPAEFEANLYPYMKIRLKNTTDADTMTMRFASDGSQHQLSFPTNTAFEISSGDTDFKEYIIDVRAANMASVDTETIQLSSSMWVGYITKLQFSFDVKTDAPQTMYIDYIAFCESLSEAQSFTPPAGSDVEQPKINTGAKAPVWVFDTEEKIYSTDISGIFLSSVGNMMHITPSTSDPIMVLPIEPELYFDTAEFPYFAYRHSTVSTVSTAGLFYTTSTLTSLSDESYSPFKIKNDGTWQNIIVNLGDTNLYPKDNWHGICDYVRIDPINGTDLDADIYIDRMGFFRTQSEAYQFLSQGRSEPDLTKGAVFIDKMYKVTVPEGNLFKGFDEFDFAPVSTVPEGEGTIPVVLKTDKNGNTSPVPMSYVSKYNYTTYIATDPATYTLGYNTKAFTDTDNHWAQEYINFVSAHEILNGTSQNEFSPDMPITRAMFVTALGRMHGVDTPEYTDGSSYTDIASDIYYAPYVRWAEENGLLNCLGTVEFQPEKAITRLEIAHIITDYISAFGYNITAYDDITEFTDISSVDEKDISAVGFTQSLGIFAGVNDTEFDPCGILTRAEAAAVAQKTVKAVLGVNTATTQYAPEYFSRDRIRIGAWGFSSVFGNKKGMTLLRDLGVDLIVSGGATSGTNTKEPTFNYADKYGIELFVTDFPTRKNLTEYDFGKHVASYSEHPSFSGHYITDEPGSDDFGWLGELAKMYNEQMPDKIPFVNLLPMYANAAQLKFGAGAAAIEYYDPDPDRYRKHCQMWFENFDVDYICTDIYPLNGTTGIENRSTWWTYKDYCESINQIATVARENNAEFWCCIQTWGWAEGKRTPTEGEYRWQCYTMLSYGCTGILLWSLTTQNRERPSIFNIYTKDITQPVYNDCKTVMWEMRRLSDTFIQYKNLGAFTLNCTDATPWLKMSGEYKDFDILSETVSDQPLLIGCFEKKEGTGHAFTVVNMTDLKDNTPATLKFKTASSVTVTLYTKNEPVILTPDASGYYTVNLQSTDGVFVTLG
ncbi:MAG: S-layer homology domain-containing protein [Ruminococcaceae bacterium]|nr:S-layer homology domain-containing protein [Oscillospiraceae bacterium]